MKLFHLMLSVLCLATLVVHGNSEDAVPLPAGVKAVWDMDKAFHEKTSTRERICLNGLWRWQPARNDKGLATLNNPLVGDIAVPNDRWGYFKVPGCWPGLENWQQKDSQTIISHPSWSGEGLGGLSTAWYQREIVIPKGWAGRRISIATDTLNSLATFYLDGKPLTIDGKTAGKIFFPGGETEITGICRPGEKQILSALVLAEPLSGVTLSFADSGAPKAASGDSVPARRGFCGDVFLVGTPVARIAGMKITTSYRKGEIAVEGAVEGLKADAQYSLRVQIMDHGKKVKEFTGKPFTSANLVEGHIEVVEKWMAEKLWDTNTPQNQYQLELSLLDPSGKAVDISLPESFGYREFWIDGRDFYLNGTRIWLSTMRLSSPEVSAGTATYAAARETMQRLKSFGINFTYTGPFNCLPGAHLGYSEILRAADDVGMLLSFSLPHMGHYLGDWTKPVEEDPQSTYARHATAYVRQVQNHPAIVAWVMNFNAGDIGDDMKAELIDGKPLRDTSNSLKMARSAALVRHVDPSRVIYNHGSGNVGSIHTANFYPNWTPIQELNDWFEHWATEGVKPVYTCEYGAPYSWDWTMYRGYYKGVRNWNASLPWEFCIAEWSSQLLGDKVFEISESEKINLRFESKKNKAGETWKRWDFPVPVGSPKLAETHIITGMYLHENFRAYRTWGVSAISPWEFDNFWRRRDGLDTGRKECPVDWENLQRPGFSPDFVANRDEAYQLAFETTDWVPSEAVKSLARDNMPLLAYIAGKPARFTSKDNNFISGETFEKQLIIINNSRVTVSCDCTWSLGLSKAIAGTKKVSVKTGEQERIPLHFELPATLAPGSYTLTASVSFSSGETQQDSFAIHVLAPPKVAKSTKIALFDPKGETATVLKGAGIDCQSVEAGADLSAFDTLIVGKAALTVDGAAPDIMRVRDGLKVIIFEQTAPVLEKRFGFRALEYGLRNVWTRIPDHPMLAGLKEENLHDWRGEATIMPAQGSFVPTQKFYGAPCTTWCDIVLPQFWRCGCRGNVASVLIEKPACGDFLPVVDGGYSLQYSPLMEYHEGKGLVIFCQLDVTGRTESDSAATVVTRNILNYVSTWKPSPIRKVVYAGDATGKAHLEKTGLTVEEYKGAALTSDQVLVVSAGGEKILAANASAVATWIKAGGNMLALGLDEAQANAFMPTKVSMKVAEHIGTYFDRPALASGLAGVGPADVHNRDPRNLPLVSGGATVIGDGVLGKAGNVVFCQMVPWQYPYTIPQFLKKTFRRSSFLVTRLLANMNVGSATPILERFHKPMDLAKPEKRWSEGLYLDQPEEWDFPYRFFRY